MSKLMMLAGGQVGGADVGRVSAYVVLSAGTQSRIFKVVGTAFAPVVTELPAATTIDLTVFRREVVEDLPRGGFGMVTPDAGWVCGMVRAHLKKSEGLEIG